MCAAHRAPCILFRMGQDAVPGGKPRFELPPILRQPNCEKCTAVCCWALTIQGGTPSAVSNRAAPMVKMANEKCEYMVDGKCAIYAERDLHGLHDPCVIYHCAEAGPLLTHMFESIFGFRSDAVPPVGAADRLLFLRRKEAYETLFRILQYYMIAILGDEQTRNLGRRSRATQARRMTNAFLAQILDTLAACRGAATSELRRECDAYVSRMDQLYPDTHE